MGLLSNGDLPRREQQRAHISGNRLQIRKQGERGRGQDDMPVNQQCRRQKLIRGQAYGVVL